MENSQEKLLNLVLLSFETSRLFLHGYYFIKHEQNVRKAVLSDVSIVFVKRKDLVGSRNLLP